MNGYDNRETFVLASFMMNERGLMETIVHDLFHTGANFDNINSVSYELEHWFYNYLHPWHWKHNVGEDMPYRVIEMAGDIGSLWRVNWKEVAPYVMESAPDYLKDELVSDEEVGLVPHS